MRKSIFITAVLALTEIRESAKVTGAYSHHKIDSIQVISRWNWYPLTALTLRAGGDAGAAWSKGNTTVEGSAFYQWTVDSIHWSMRSGTWQPENVGEAVFFGADAGAKTKVPLPKGWSLSFRGSYQYLYSALLSYGYVLGDNKRIPYMPAHVINAAVEAAWKAPIGPGSLALTTRFEGKRYTDTANIIALDPYVLLTINASQRLSSVFTVYAVVRNALNTSYTTMADYPMPGTTITIGLRFGTPEKKDKS